MNVGRREPGKEMQSFIPSLDKEEHRNNAIAARCLDRRR